MPEFGDIFDYRSSAVTFEYLTLSFMIAYALAVAWIAIFARSTADPLGGGTIDNCQLSSCGKLATLMFD